jgi:AraC-like DNA-binding protein
MDLHLNRVGVRYFHPPGATINRPSGGGDYLFLHFTAPVKILLVNELTHEPPHTCIVYTPTYRQFYQGEREGLRNNWLHFKGKDAPTLLKRYNIPVNTLFYPKYTEFIEPVLREIRREKIRQEVLSHQAISLFVEIFFIKLSRSLEQNNDGGFSPRKLRLRETLRDIRHMFHDNLTEDWSVSKMAETAHLSESRFLALYREFFGISPIEDLIEARLEYAKWLLNNSQATVSEVAYRSGFNNIYYFSRLFHKRVGCPPSEYHQISL